MEEVWNLLIENNHYYKSLDDKTKFQELKKLVQKPLIIYKHESNNCKHRRQHN